MQAMPRVLIALCLLAMASAATIQAKATAPAAAPLESLVIMQVDGNIVIDPLGRVADYRVDTPVLEELRVAIDRAVRQWRFQPVVIDGTPRRVSAKMRVVLAATRIAEKFQVKIDNVVFPDADKSSRERWKNENASATISIRSIQPPGYPRALMQAGVSGRVLLGVRIGADGRVAEVVAIQSMVFDVSGRDRTLAAAIRQFEGAAVSAAKSWRFNVVAKSVALAPKDMTGMVPVEFVMDRSKVDLPGQWRTVVRLPKRPMGWLKETPEIQKIGVSDVVNGELISLSDSPVLASAVIGTELL